MEQPIIERQPVPSTSAGRRGPLSWLLYIALPLLLFTPAGAAEEEVLFFPSYGYMDGSRWVIPLRVKVQEPRRVDNRVIGAILDRLGIGDSRERSNYVARVRDFVADDQSLEHVRIRFDADPRRERYSISDPNGQPLRTGSDGIAEGTITLEAARAQQILGAQGSATGWLRFAATDHAGRGRVRLIEASGVSVISDIDDTIKVTEVPAGKRVLAQNTFCRDFVSAPELTSRYAALAGAPVHYVSGGPWQLYRPLATFIGQAGFPDGSFHMRIVGGSVLTASASLEALGAFVSADGTFNHKVEQIRRIMIRFPARKFVLIGDSGEQDPEVYTAIRSEFPKQVQEIVIRDVVNARETEPHRLTGMTVVAAPTVTRGASRPRP